MSWLFFWVKFVPGTDGKSSRSLPFTSNSLFSGEHYQKGEFILKFFPGSNSPYF